MTSCGAAPPSLSDDGEDDRLGGMLEAISVGVARFDRAHRPLYVNRAYGAAGAEEDQAPEVVRIHGERALEGRTSAWRDWLEWPGEAEPRFVEGVCIPHAGAGGGVEGYRLLMRDLTELKRTERRLVEQMAVLDMSKALGAAMTASALDCVIMIDEAGCVVQFNPAAEQTFGHRRADVLGKPIGDVIVPDHLRAQHVAGFARYLATGEARTLGRRVEIDGMRADGEIFPLELTITDVSLPGRRLFTAYLRDLSKVKADAAEIARSREALHQSEKMAAFGSLLAGVAHELNNPLSIVIGHALMLDDDAVGVAPALAERATKIRSAAERCGGIVRTYLAMARQRPIALRPLALRPLVTASIDLLAYNLRTSGVTVEVAIAEDLPSAVGDADQLTQVLVNLLVNSQQALQARPLPRHISVAASADGDGLQLSVTDNGPGVPAENRSRVFDPFFTTKPMGHGTGIGLAVSRGIVEAHGGTLTLAVAEQGGARFEVRLRTAAAAEVAGALAPLPDEPAEFAAPSGGVLALIIDDEPEVAAILAQMVSALGFQCDVAGGGDEACVLLERQDYDVILCDLHMPERDGSALFDWLQDRKRHLHRRVAFITGDTLGPATGRFLARAGRPVLEKPFMPEEVRRIVHGLCAPQNPL
ncbi:PAS domain S-box protein [Phenylobacterium sp. LjRoot225]|uniref:ATP-binding protein n=1 Tax=Phenylobacterium sp. LjRoot225 TaxID=3342285 RepID=UPI003ECDF4A8